MIFERDFRGKLGLVVGAIEAHFQFGGIFEVLFDHVHWLEGLFRHLETNGLVDAVKGRYGLLGVVEVLVIPFHIFGISMRYCYIIGKLCVSQNFLVSICSRVRQESLGSVCSTVSSSASSQLFGDGKLTKYTEPTHHTPPRLLQHLYQRHLDHW